MILKKVIVSILTIFLASYGVAQQITIQSFSSGTYARGASISIPVKITGCFALDNRFEMYLSDATGSFSSATKIGSYDGFFTPFINGIIPNGVTPGGNYKIRVVATNPSVFTETGNISIAATSASPVVNPVSTASNIINDSTYGRCLITSNQNIVLQETPPAGSSFSAQVFDSLGNNVSAAISTSQVQFTIVPGNYYSVSIQIKINIDNIISTKSYYV